MSITLPTWNRLICAFVRGSTSTAGVPTMKSWPTCWARLIRSSTTSAALGAGRSWWTGTGAPIAADRTAADRARADENTPGTVPAGPSRARDPPLGLTDELSQPNRKDLFAKIRLQSYGRGVDLTSITPSPQQMKALTHPVRVRMLGMLRIDGPATATTLAARLGLNTGATSYHLRQLAAARLRGRGRRARQRPRPVVEGRAPVTTTDTPARRSRRPRDTLDAYLQSVVVVTTERLQRSVEELPLLPEEWRDATTYSDWVVKLTPGAGASASSRS